jgi:DNA-dependent RNA polymerase auxiliary subunit epsilon
MSSTDLIEEVKTPLLNDTDNLHLDKPNDKKQYVKILIDDMKHHDFQYKEGLNVDIHKFTPYGECQKGGLYFCELSDAYLYLCYGSLIADVEIPLDANVYHEKNKLKANKIILKNIRPIKEHEIWNNLEFCEKAVNKSAHYIEYAKVQTKELCLLSIATHAPHIRYIKNQTLEMCMFAIGSDPSLIQYITDQTPDLCKMAIVKDGKAMQYIKNQTDELCRFAINQNGYNIKYIRDKTPELCKLAVSVCPSSIRYINDQTSELCKTAVENDAYNIRFIDIQTEDLCWIALKDKLDTYRYIKKPTDEMKKYYKSHTSCIVM